MVGKRVRYTPAATAGMMCPERATKERGLCVGLEAGIAWVVWAHAYAPIWEIASELQLAED